MIEARLWERKADLYKQVVKASILALEISEETKNAGRPLRRPVTTEALYRILAEDNAKETAQA